MRTTVVVGLLLAGLCGAARADVENFEKFLRDCEAAMLVPVPLRGDGQLEVTTPSGSTHNTVVMIVRPPAETYVELRAPEFKAALLSQGQAYRVAAGAAKAETFAADATVGDSDFAREDLEPFQLAHYKDWRIADENANEVTVTLFPKAPQYSLVVITFDRERMMPLKTLYYRDTVNNLAKMRRDTNFVLVGRKWMPTSISMESFKLRTHSTLTVQWAQSPNFPPELFDPVFLPRLSAAAASPTAAAAPATK